MFANMVRVPVGCAVPSASSIDHYLDSLFRQVNGGSFRRSERRLQSKTTEAAYELTFEIPGFSREEIDISVEDRTLTIKAIKPESQDHAAPFFANAERRLEVPEDGELEKISANLTNGVLTLKIPRNAPQKVSRKIDIS